MNEKQNAGDILNTRMNSSSSRLLKSPQLTMSMMTRENEHDSAMMHRSVNHLVFTSSSQIRFPLPHQDVSTKNVTSKCRILGICSHLILDRVELWSKLFFLLNAKK